MHHSLFRQTQIERIRWLVNLKQGLSFGFSNLRVIFSFWILFLSIHMFENEHTINYIEFSEFAYNDNHWLMPFFNKIIWNKSNVPKKQYLQSLVSFLTISTLRTLVCPSWKNIECFVLSNQLHGRYGPHLKMFGPPVRKAISRTPKINPRVSNWM